MTTLGEMRTAVAEQLTTGEYHAGADNWDVIDRAIRAACRQILRKTDITRTTGSVACTAYDNELDMSSIAGFRKERLIICEIGYTDQGTWSAAAVSYVLNDLVQGDGDPDSYLYVCHTAHTSAAGNEPPNTTYWRKVDNKMGTRVVVRSYDEVVGQRTPTVASGYPWRWRHPYLRYPNEGEGSWGDQYVTADRPTMIAFKTHTLAYLYPTPKVAYPVNVTFKDDLISWTIGDDDQTAVVINISDEYTDAIMHWGAPAIVENPDPADRKANLRWANFMAEVQAIKSEVGVRPMVTTRRPNDTGM